MMSKKISIEISKKIHPVDVSSFDCPKVIISVIRKSRPKLEPFSGWSLMSSEVEVT